MTCSVWSLARRGPCVIGAVGLQAVAITSASTAGATARSSLEPGITVSIFPSCMGKNKGATLAGAPCARGLTLTQNRAIVSVLRERERPSMRPLPRCSFCCCFLDRQRLQVDRLRFEDPRRLLARLLVVVQPGPGRDELADDHVLLEASQAVHLAADRGFGEHTGGLLEGRRRQP